MAYSLTKNQLSIRAENFREASEGALNQQIQVLSLLADTIKLHNAMARRHEKHPDFDILGAITSTALETIDNFRELDRLLDVARSQLAAQRVEDLKEIDELYAQEERARAEKVKTP